MNSKSIQDRMSGGNQHGPIPSRLRYWASRATQANLRNYGSQLQEALCDAAERIEELEMQVELLQHEVQHDS